MNKPKAKVIDSNTATANFANGMRHNSLLRESYGITLYAIHGLSEITEETRRTERIDRSLRHAMEGESTHILVSKEYIQQIENRMNSEQLSKLTIVGIENMENMNLPEFLSKFIETIFRGNPN